MIDVDKSTVKLNCPECKTGYVADTAEITNARPEFDCVSCGIRFYFDYDPAIFFIEDHPATAQTFRVPLPRITATPGISHDLTQVWELILREYENRDHHERFLDQCLKNKKLAYAAQLYRARIEEFPHDSLAREMGDRAFQMAAEHMRSLHHERQLFTTHKKASRQRGGFWLFLVYVGAIIGIAGFLVPHGRTLVVFGAITLSAGLIFKWRGRRLLG